MSVQAIVWVLEHSKAQGATRCVLMSIANHVGVDGEGWVYVQRVMSEANCSHDTYKRAVKWAVEHGELSREVNQGEAKKAADNRRPNHFRLLQLGGASCPPHEPAALRKLHPPEPAACPVQDAPPEPSLVLEPSKEPFPLSFSDAIDKALDLLAERDATRGNPQNPRGYRMACRRTREQESRTTLAGLVQQHPDWSPEALADAVDENSATKAKRRTDLWCSTCRCSTDHYTDQHPQSVTA